MLISATTKSFRELFKLMFGQKLRYQYLGKLAHETHHDKCVIKSFCSQANAPNWQGLNRLLRQQEGCLAHCKYLKPVRFQRIVRRISENLDKTDRQTHTHPLIQKQKMSGMCFLFPAPRSVEDVELKLDQSAVSVRLLLFRSLLDLRFPLKRLCLVPFPCVITDSLTSDLNHTFPYLFKMRSSGQRTIFPWSPLEMSNLRP